MERAVSIRVLNPLAPECEILGAARKGHIPMMPFLGTWEAIFFLGPLWVVRQGADSMPTTEQKPRGVFARVAKRPSDHHRIGGVFAHGCSQSPFRKGRVPPITWLG
jgi:hypothetical protein